MSRNLLRAIACLQLAAEQPHWGNLVAAVCVPVPEGSQIPDSNPREVMTRFPWASPSFGGGPKGTCLSTLSVLRLSYMRQNIGKVCRARTILRAGLVFWDTTLEKPPVCNSLNTLHKVSNVNKAQRRNVYIKICFTACSIAGSASWLEMLSSQHLLEC